jgi:lysozyme
MIRIQDGIDVSHHQGTVNWQAVARGGISFAFVKATEGATFVDSQFDANWAGMKNNGLLRGAYHFFRPGTTVRKQVDNFVMIVNNLEQGDLPPVLDIEQAPRMGVDEWDSVPVVDRVPIVQEWLEAVEQKLGRKPVIYIRRGFVEEKLLHAPEPLSKYLLWVAHYTLKSQPAIPGIWSDWAFWQHSDKGEIRGISGPVDSDRFNGSLEELLALAKADTSDIA